MSACALAVSADGNQVVLAGDGMTTKGNEVHSLNRSKVLRINDSIGTLWMGIGKASVGEHVAKEANNIKTVKEVADCVSKWMKRAYDTPENRHLLEKLKFWIFIIGYDETGLNAYRVWSGSDKRFMPEKQNMPPGTLGAKTATKGPDKTSFQKLVATKYWPLYKPNLQHAVKEAFTEMVNTYNKAGELCGGTIFTEVITRPAP